MLATAWGLLGWTLDEVTDGQPFWGQTAASTSPDAHRDEKAHLVKIQLLPVPVRDKPIQVVQNQGPSFIPCVCACKGSSLSEDRSDCELEMTCPLTPSERRTAACGC